MENSQYLNMFLEESMENLQTLNEALLQLEQTPDDKDKLNEIFRVAHSIKGMAATMGFARMAELTHKMEDVLTKFREGELTVTAKVVTVLFNCLDTLERMVSELQDGVGDDSIEIEEIMSDLEAIAEGGSGDVFAGVYNEEADSIAPKGIVLNEYDRNVAKEALSKGYKTYEVGIQLSETTILKSARGFLVFKTLEESGEIIKSVPAVEDIENENFDYEIRVIYVTTKDADEIETALMGVSEISSVTLENIDASRVKEVVAVDKPAVVPTEDVAAPVRPVEVTKPKVTKKESKEGKDTVGPKKAHQSVRVDLERLDIFMNMVSELVIHRTRLEQISSNYKLGDLTETLEQVARTTSDLQDLVMKIRMLPLDIVFNRFPRMIRDLSVELGKDMELEIQGQDTELDRTVIDEIGEPLLHLLRNSADHGIESKESRLASGKNAVGKIKLIAYQEGTKAVIKVEDDGAGINLEKIKAKAEKVGIKTEGMSDSDIRNLIFAQGFSTNEVVTDISGRGVGMDVVKTKIAALGGTVDVVSEMGKGTSFIIKLPLTLQIIQALLVKVGNETMAISLGYIDKVITFDKEQIKKTNNKEVIIYRGEVIPLIRACDKLDLETSAEEKNFVVIVNVGEKTAGILVDTLLGQQEIVIKPLGDTLKGMKEYIGATILGDGLVTLILDVAALI